MRKKKLPVISIVGRLNVGKSTLFNRLIGKRDAIVKDIPGVTRDRKSGILKIGNYKFELIDTGGLGLNESNPIEELVKKQTERAIEESDLILFVVDAREGVVSIEEEIAIWLKKSNKPVIVIANKIDEEALKNNVYEFYSLGFDKIIGISAEHNRGIGQLLEQILEILKSKIRDIEIEEPEIKVAIVGRPNCGKSSLVNCILKEERVLVSEIPGTTRDSIDTIFKWQKTNICLIDTAGIRKRAKVKDKLEKLSVIFAIKSIERSDVVILMIDSTEGIGELEAKIGGIIKEKKKSSIIVWNKWDLVKNDANLQRIYLDYTIKRLHHIGYSPIVTISAKSGLRIGKLLNTVLEVYKRYTQRVSIKKLNKVVSEAITHHTPPLQSTRRPYKIYYSSQIGIKPPTFLLLTNSRETLHFSYQRYLENKLREAFDFRGTPIILKFKKKGKDK